MKQETYARTLPNVVYYTYLPMYFTAFFFANFNVLAEVSVVLRRQRLKVPLRSLVLYCDEIFF